MPSWAGSHADAVAASIRTNALRYAQTRLIPCADTCTLRRPQCHINQVERFFALPTGRALGRGVFRSVADLEKAIEVYIEATNADTSLNNRELAGDESLCVAFWSTAFHASEARQPEKCFAIEPLL